jgi:hypothetical protein
VATVVVAALVAVIMGEYEPTLWTALATAVVVGAGLPEVPLGVARWRGRVPAAVTAVCAGVSLVWAGWISAGRGLNPIRGTVWLSAVLAAAIAALRLARGGQQDAVAVAGGDGDDPASTIG